MFQPLLAQQKKPSVVEVGVGAAVEFLLVVPQWWCRVTATLAVTPVPVAVLM